MKIRLRWDSTGTPGNISESKLNVVTYIESSNICDDRVLDIIGDQGGDLDWGFVLVFEC